MKKISLALILALLMQVLPSRAMASFAPPPTSFAPIGAAALAVFALCGGFDGAAPTTKATGNEFVDLNNGGSFNDLLKQQAGGSQDTMEILK